MDGAHNLNFTTREHGRDETRTPRENFPDRRALRSGGEAQENLGQSMVEGAAREDFVGSSVACLLEELPLHVRPPREHADGPIGLARARALEPRDEVERDFGRVEIDEEALDAAFGESGGEHFETSHGTGGDSQVVGERLDPGGPQQIGGKVKEHLGHCTRWCSTYHLDPQRAGRGEASRAAGRGTRSLA